MRLIANQLIARERKDNWDEENAYECFPRRWKD